MKRPIVVALFAAASLVALSGVRLLAADGDKPAAPPPAAPPAVNPVLDAKIRKLMTLNGSEASMRMMMEKTIAQLEHNTKLPAGFAAMFKSKADLKAIIELVVPVYAKHLDEPTLDGLIAFYESTAGRKLVAEQPAMLSETTDAAAVWGRKLGEEIARDLKEVK